MSHLTIAQPGPITMTSREIAELTGKEHRNVMRDIRVMLAELYGENRVLSFEQTVQRPNPSGGAPISSTVYALPKRETFILVSGYSVALRARIVDRWQELEQHAAGPALPDFSNPAAAARAWADEVEARQRLELESRQQAGQLAIAAPKAAALDRITASAGTLTITEAAKVLGIKRDQLTSWMHANGWIYRLNKSWVGYQAHIQSGDLEYKEATYRDEATGLETAKPYCHITQKGLTKLARAIPRQQAEPA